MYCRTSDNGSLIAKIRRGCADLIADRCASMNQMKKDIKKDEADVNGPRCLVEHMQHSVIRSWHVASILGIHTASCRLMGTMKFATTLLCTLRLKKLFADPRKLDMTVNHTHAPPVVLSSNASCYNVFQFATLLASLRSPLVLPLEGRYRQAAR